MSVMCRYSDTHTTDLYRADKLTSIIL